MLKKIFWCLAMVTILVSGGCGTQQKPLDDGYYKMQNSEPDLTVYMHKTGKTEKMKLEKYIEGVVAGEMRNDWDINALAAQAIIARTFTLQAYEKGELTSQGTNASTDIREFQAYNAEAVNDRIQRAVEITRGKVAVYNGVPIMGWFHASAGGQTATAKEGLDYPYDNPPFIKSVASPDDLAPADIQNWSVAYSLYEFSQVLAKMSATVDRVEKVAIGKKGESGRAETIIINGSVEVSAPELRLALGSTNLKSMLLKNIEINDGKVIFSGSGYGHGVGMSQWGAQKLALAGKTPDEIVKHYFKDIEIEKRW